MQPIRDEKEGARVLESMLLKQLLEESRVLDGSGQAGGKLYASMFCEALANAVAQSGGLGIAELVEGTFAADENAKEAPQNLTHNYLIDTPPRADSLESMPRVTSTYGARKDPIHGHPRFHPGIDVAAEEGSLILALSSGVVKQAGPRGAYGNAVEIDAGQGISMLYGHAQTLTVREGDRVTEGQVIANVGQTGRATGPHLHFEVRKEGKTTDPEITLIKLNQRADVLIGRKAQNVGNGEEP